MVRSAWAPPKIQVPVGASTWLLKNSQPIPNFSRLRRQCVIKSWAGTVHGLHVPMGQNTANH